MKTITNKKIVFVTKEPNPQMTKIVDVYNNSDYFTLIEEACNRASNPQSGFTYDDIKKIDRVKTAIKSAVDQVMTVEDTDYDFIKDRIESKGWPSSSIEIVEFIDYIKSIK